MAVAIQNKTEQKEDEAWYEKVFNWFGSTAKDVYVASLQSKQAQAEAEAIRLAKEEKENQTLSFFGKELSKQTILWIAGGSIVAILLFNSFRRR